MEVHAAGMPTPVVPLEDELGDVLEKALRGAAMTPEQLAAETDTPLAGILDAIDYRSELTNAQLGRIARQLSLNEVGLCALARGAYPLPSCPGLPFSLWPVRMAHGVGVANAYLVAEPGSDCGILFDTGPNIGALLAQWPPAIKRVAAVFLTHVEPEHTGGLCDVVAYFGIPAAFVPVGGEAPCGQAMPELEPWPWAGVEVTAYHTPGHASAHNCYRVRAAGRPGAAELLVAGDLLFAGSAGGAYFCGKQQRRQLRRILELGAGNTVVAPGHGPLTTLENERRYNPFMP